MSKRLPKSFKILLVGAGNVGSRHLQALKAVNIPLKIFVVDPSAKSLQFAKERYDSAPAEKLSHGIKYYEEIPDEESPIDLAIIATCSDIRAEIIRKLFKKSKVRFLVLEKLLFGKREDYDSIGKLIKKAGTKTWVNCPRRMMSFYNNLQPEFLGRTIFYNAVWSGYDLATNAIQCLDHMVFLTGSDDFTIDTDGLDKQTVPSKRRGFLEFTGALRVLFKNGSIGDVVCFREGSVPVVVQFNCDQVRYVVRETESKAWISRATNNWKWSEIKAPLIFQSRLTTQLAEDILTKGTCQLPIYEDSKKIHLQLLEPLLKFLNKHSIKKYNYFPFT